MVRNLIVSMLRIFFTKQFLTFAFFGLIAVLINLTVRLVLNFFLSFSMSVFLAHIFAMGCAFFLFKTYVFSRYRNLRNSLFKFIIINCISLFQVWAVSYFMAYIFLPSLGISGFIYLISHLLGVFSTLITSYIGHKLWTFSR